MARLLLPLLSWYTQRGRRLPDLSLKQKSCTFVMLSVPNGSETFWANFPCPLNVLYFSNRQLVLLWSLAGVSVDVSGSEALNKLNGGE